MANLDQQDARAQKIFNDIKIRSTGGLSYAGSLQILQSVREFEAVNTALPTRAAIASARGEDIERLALLDNLTELYNYKTFLKELKAEINRARRYKHPVSLCMLAIDNYEAIKQQFGNLTAESVLRIVGNVLRGAIREVDIGAKYDETTFAVVLPNAHASNAALVAERIRQRIGNQAIAHNWQNFSVTASLGVAAYPVHGVAHDELSARALEALSFAIHRGGDRVFCV
jgi:diguanylate cyclase (GGDEF)-like protein